MHMHYDHFGRRGVNRQKYYLFDYDRELLECPTVISRIFCIAEFLSTKQAFKTDIVARLGNWPWRRSVSCHRTAFDSSFYRRFWDTELPDDISAASTADMDGVKAEIVSLLKISGCILAKPEEFSIGRRVSIFTRNISAVDGIEDVEQDRRIRQRMNEMADSGSESDELDELEDNSPT